MYAKPLICVVGKLLLQYLLNVLYCAFLTEKILFQDIFASWKQMLGIDKKPSFLLKNIYLHNLWYLAALKTLKARGEVVYFKWKLTLSKTTEWLSMNVIGRLLRRRLFFVPASSSLFRAVSFFTSNGVAECFDLNIYCESASCRLYYKGLQASL